MRKIIALVTVLFPLLLFSTPGGAVTLSDEERSIQAASKALGSTVKIRNSLDTGSGFYIAPKLILTNLHVMENAEHIIFTIQDGKRCEAKLGYREEGLDAALLHTDCEGIPLPLQESYRVAESVIVVGNPSYFDFTVTRGSVSAKREGYLQIDAKINHGNSGGPAVNLNGEVIGMVSMKAKDNYYIGYAIETRYLKKFIERSGVNGLTR